MADRKQRAGWSSGSSAAGHKAHCISLQAGLNYLECSLDAAVLVCTVYAVT